MQQAYVADKDHFLFHAAFQTGQWDAENPPDQKKQDESQNTFLIFFLYNVVKGESWRALRVSNHTAIFSSMSPVSSTIKMLYLRVCSSWNTIPKHYR